MKKFLGLLLLAGMFQLALQSGSNVAWGQKSKTVPGRDMRKDEYCKGANCANSNFGLVKYYDDNGNQINAPEGATCDYLGINFYACIQSTEANSYCPSKGNSYCLGYGYDKDNHWIGTCEGGFIDCGP